MNSQFHSYSPADLKCFFARRDGEERIGEVIFTASDSYEHELLKFTGKYVVVGVAEDIGPQANLGRGGANETFEAFLRYWLNMQNNRFTCIQNCMLLGCIAFSTNEVLPEKLRKCTEQIDKEVQALVQLIFASGKIPILIGGGHNNALPLIKAFSQVAKQKISVLNLDPHADFRALEGRHSGNSFSYATREEVLDKYGVIGLHKAYNSESMLQNLDNNHVFYTFFDDYLKGDNTMISDSQIFLTSVTTPIGIELDLDAIENMPSSAMSAMGWSQVEARKWLLAVKQFSPIYYHFPEGAPKWAPNGERTVGRFLSYLVNDIIAD
jgi:formiminoglutamase